MDHKSLTACAIIVAGGVGRRAGGGNKGREQINLTVPKQLQALGGKPVIVWSVEAFSAHPQVIETIVVCADEYRETMTRMIAPLRVAYARAGPTRTASVRAGLALAKEVNADIILIHDAARPGLDTATLDLLIGAISAGHDGAVPVLPVADALWHSADDLLDQPQDRTGLLRVQTPQAFVGARILEAYDQLNDSDELADDIAVARQLGLWIAPVTGTARLDKITWPEDFARMTALLQPQLIARTGTGIDAHKFDKGSFVTLCGVQIAHTHGLAGHSDADVGWHALADAIYGGLGAGDIGHHFPPSDARWRGAPSSIFLQHAGDLVRASGGILTHVDVTLVCELPKVGPHRSAMIAATAQLLNLRLDQVSIKATTTEGMGFTGRREGIAAQASATLLLPDSYRGAPILEPNL
jgi:2-C-methyl-D-erythritol 4-phosphate cytidylyltransferase / 2-C-methyl-D-erythritol 2,4-cyclodiphosphate synthase